MALRAFHANPCIGGFGGENTTPSLLRPKNRDSSHGQQPRTANVPDGSNSGDAFCQIVKELVDNAVDAVNSLLREEENDLSGSNGDQKRIRVEIMPYGYPGKENTNENAANDTCLNEESSNLLKIDVLDNGCGMENIKECVNAFHSTKANSQSQGDSGEACHSNTSGRYGIGLTLCLLHAQRLVPDSFACITTTRKSMKYTARALLVVDPKNDEVVCHEEVHLPKDDTAATGTSVSLLIPRASANPLAWERLVAYFWRFRLCPNLVFGIEVLAPTLERVPLFIRPKPLKKASADTSGTEPKSPDPTFGASVTKNSHKSQNDPSDINSWDELNADQVDMNNSQDEINSERNDLESLPPVLVSKSETRRMEIMEAAMEYWRDRKIALKNTAVSSQRIRPEGSVSHDSALELEVNLLVCPLPSRNVPDDNYGDFDDDERSVSSQQRQGSAENAPAEIELVRMVNDVPILDGAEAHSCGLVHGLEDKTTWGSFGLDISKKATHEMNRNAILPSTGCKWTPTFELQDDFRVEAFIQRDANHKQLHCLADDEYDANNSNDEDFDELNSLDSQARKRSTLRQMDDLLPAGIRLHSVLIIVRIRAAPESLPLPTLSKGRLPLNHAPINDALQRGLNECLWSLQVTNPLLLLSPNQLNSVVRDVRYIPKLAKEIALSVCKTRNPLFQKRAKEILKMASELKGATNGEAQHPSSFDSTFGNEEKLEPSQLSIAFRQVLSFKVQARMEALEEKRKCEKEEAKAANRQDNALGDDDFEEIGCESAFGAISAKGKAVEEQTDGNGNERRLSRRRSFGQLSTSSWKEIGSDNSPTSKLTPQEQFDSDRSACSTAPMKAVSFALAHGGVPIEESEDDFDDDWS